MKLTEDDLFIIHEALKQYIRSNEVPHRDTVSRSEYVKDLATKIWGVLNDLREIGQPQIYCDVCGTSYDEDDRCIQHSDDENWCPQCSHCARMLP